MSTLFDLLLVAYFGIFIPIYGATVSYPRFKRAVARNEPGIRVSSYKRGTLRAIFDAALVLATWFSFGRSPIELGVAVPQPALFLIGLVPALVVASIIFAMRRSLAESQTERNLARRLMGPILPSLPHTKEERLWFMLLAFAAGTGEELIFRGYLIWYFANYGGYLLAFFVSSLLFGFGHLYQGAKMARAKVTMGMLFAGIYLVSESLWIPMTLHIYIDIETARAGYQLLGPRKEAS